jgi:hypothetical protein
MHINQSLLHFQLYVKTDLHQQNYQDSSMVYKIRQVKHPPEDIFVHKHVADSHLTVSEC